MPNSPFKLLEPYNAQEKDIFFGRESEIYALYHLLKQTRLVLIYGASGTGKTSLIQAGLPKVFKISDWFRIPIRRKDNINQSLEQELSRISRTTNDGLAATLQAIYQQRWMPIYLVFDQFEEIFTLGQIEERIQFFETLQQLLTQPLPCKIILSMREEYIGHLYDYEHLVPSLFQKRFRVEAMKDSTIVEVIEKMTVTKGVLLENKKETAKQILQQVKEGKQAAYLPYLQIYLYYLHEYSAKTGAHPVVFDSIGITKIGVLGNVVNRFIDSKIDEAQNYLSQFNAPPNFAATILDEFATSEGTKKAMLTEILIKRLKVAPILVKNALIYFSNTAKILRADENEIERYEPVHDIVAKQIHELRTEESKEFKAFERKLEFDYELWVKDQYATERLLPSLDLNQVQIFTTRLQKKEDYQKKLATYIDKSKQFLAQKIQQKKRRNLILYATSILLAVLGILAVGFGIYAYQQKNIAEDALIKAQQQQIKALQNEAQRVQGEVKIILKNANKIQQRYPQTAIEMKRVALQKLQAHPENATLKKQAADLAHEIQQNE